MKITLENNQEVEISQESYNALLNAVQDGNPKMGQDYWHIDNLGLKERRTWNNTVYDNKRLKIGNVFLIEKACDMAILRLKARALGDKVVEGKKMYYWSYYDRKAYISNLPQANLDGIWFNTAEKCEEVMKKYEHAFTYLMK